MRRTIIKICGITRVEDGLAAIEAGADWLGFIRVPRTPRHRMLEACAETLSELRLRAAAPFEAVGVFVDAPLDTILSEIDALKFDRIQLHGDEPASLAERIPVPAIKTIKIHDEASAHRAEEFPGIMLLADTADPNLPGGTGRSYDARLIRPLASRRSVILAGGLRPETVADAVRLARPFGVDVSSGVEASPGIKDAEKIRTFIQAVRPVDRELESL